MDQTTPHKNIALKIIHAVEDGLLVLVISAMILFSFSQILLRNFANTTIEWGDPFLRFMVLWVGLLGAMVATRDDNHISIDMVTYLVPRRFQAAIRILTDAFTSTICLFLTYASWRFMLDEKAMGTKAFADVPVWILEIILPLAFGIISLRYAIQFSRHFNYTGYQTARKFAGEKAAHLIKDGIGLVLFLIMTIMAKGYVTTFLAKQAEEWGEPVKNSAIYVFPAALSAFCVYFAYQLVIHGLAVSKGEIPPAPDLVERPKGGDQ